MHSTRRSFLLQAGALGAAATFPRGRRQDPSERPVAIASANGLAALARVMDELRNGADPLDAVIEGVVTVEEDPEDTLGGIWWPAQ